MIFSGLHCTKKGHQEDVRHEVYEQAQVCGEERSEECLKRAADHAEPRTPFPGQLLVSHHANTYLNVWLYMPMYQLSL